MVVAETTEIEFIQDRSPVSEPWLTGIKGLSLTLKGWHECEELRSDSGCLPDNGGPGHGSCKINILLSLAGEATGPLPLLS